MKAVVFDLDGTLLDTLADLGAACNHALKEKGLPEHPLADYRAMVGNGFETLVKRALGSQKLPEAEVASIIRSARRWYGENLYVHTVPYPGIIEALQKLAARGVLLGVLTNKPDEYAVELVEHFFGEIILAFVTGARVGHVLKPDPGELLGQLGTFGIKPQDAYYVGDSDVDVLTAQNADVTPVGAAWGFRGAEELARAGAKIILAQPIELVSLIPG